MNPLLDELDCPTPDTAAIAPAPQEFQRGPIQRADWLDASWQTFAAGESARRITYHDEQSGTASVVFTRPRGAWLTIWRQPGVDELNEPLDLVFDSPAALEQLVGLIVRRGMAVKLSRVRADSPTIDALQRAVGRLGKVIIRPRANYPYIDLDDSWRKPEDKFTSRRRSDFRRAIKRAEEIGPVSSDIRTPLLAELDDLLDQAFDIEARSWKGEAGTALLRDDRRASFFRSYARCACEQGYLRINFLRIGAQLAAMQIAVEMDGGLWLLKVGYDPEFARCSPGNLLIAASIQYAVEAGLQSYEFLGTSESWTRVWTETERETVCVRVYPLGWQSFLTLAKDGLDALRRKRQRNQA